jgi:hypothetical protein
MDLTNEPIFVVIPASFNSGAGQAGIHFAFHVGKQDQTGFPRSRE